MSSLSRQGIRGALAAIAVAVSLTVVSPAVAVPVGEKAAGAGGGSMRAHLKSVASFTDAWMAEHGGELPRRKTIKAAYPENTYPANRWDFASVRGVGYCVVALPRDIAVRRARAADYRWFDSVTGHISAPTARELDGKSSSANACPTYVRRLLASQTNEIVESLQSDLRNAAVAVETFFTDHPRSNPTMDDVYRYGFAASPGNVVTLHGGWARGYCLRGVSTSPDSPLAAGEALHYDSTRGGLLSSYRTPRGNSACGRAFGTVR